MDSMDKIDAALDSVFSAGGLTLHFYANNKTINGMREAMRKIMADSYIEGGNDTHKAMKRAYHTTGNHPRLGRCNDE